MADKITLKAQDRLQLGKKVAQLRREGFVPGHVYGSGVDSESVTLKAVDFKKVHAQAGETGLIELRIGEEKTRPVLIREVQIDPVKGQVVHVDFFQVNLKEKITVNVPLVLIGDEPELVHSGEAVVIQPMSEVEVEALPTDLPEKIEVDITSLKVIDDTITISQLSVPAEVTVLAEPESVVAKLDNAVTAEMEQLMEEAAADTAAAEAAEGEEGAEGAEGEVTEGEEGEKPEGGEAEKETEGGGNDQGQSGNNEDPQ